jgi:hypothetical protein
MAFKQLFTFLKLFAPLLSKKFGQYLICQFSDTVTGSGGFKYNTFWWIERQKISLDLPNFQGGFSGKKYIFKYIKITFKYIKTTKNTFSST